jgi:hypothetical protein
VAVSDESMACAESPSSVTSPRLESKRSGRECKVILTELDTNRGGGDRLYPATQDGNICNHIPVACAAQQDSPLLPPPIRVGICRNHAPTETVNAVPRRCRQMLALIKLALTSAQSPAPCCRHRRTHQHRARRLLQATFVAHRQGQGRDCHGPQDRSPVPQCCAIRNGLCRSRGLVLRDALPDASGQQFASTCQGIRLCSPTLGAESRRCRFLGIVLQR